VGDETDAFQAAKRICRWVDTNIRDVGTAALSNAVETLKSRQGDCTEHTVLFVALARAVGIPARECAGIVAIEGGEGLYYHAWPEVWVGEWVAMDPTLHQIVADATHLKFAHGGAEQLTRIIGLFGRLKAKVLETSQKP
jgi:transglutaminase-like putative cysteine protease